MSQLSDESSLHYHRCWWAWCRHNFFSKDHLLHHVISEHVYKTEPERLAKIQTNKRLENDYWDSLHLSAFTDTSPSKLDTQQNDTLTFLRSSLPSPPTSTPIEIPGTPNPVLETSLPNAHHVPSTRNEPNITDTPTFASLSSPINSPNGYIYSIPDSPPFHSLVEDAISSFKHSRRQTEMSAVTEESESSSSSQESESVWKYLTQDIEDAGEPMHKDDTLDDDTSMDVGLSSSEHISTEQKGQLSEGHVNPSTISTPSKPLENEVSASSSSLRIQTSHLNTINQSLQSPIYQYSPTYSSTNTPIRQAWYQAPRRRISTKKFSDPSISISITPTTSTPVSPFLIHSANPRNVHFGANLDVQQSPLALGNDIDSQSQSQTQTQTQTQQDWTQVDTQVSYPPLQTQAPYESQSQSTSQD